MNPLHAAAPAHLASGAGFLRFQTSDLHLALHPRRVVMAAAGAVAEAPAPPVLPYRVGHGFDLHRLAEGYKLIIGGVEIPHTKGCEAHSDGAESGRAVKWDRRRGAGGRMPLAGAIRARI
jgi:hypothetical protein